MADTETFVAFDSTYYFQYSICDGCGLNVTYYDTTDIGCQLEPISAMVQNGTECAGIFDSDENPRFVTEILTFGSAACGYGCQGGDLPAIQMRLPYEAVLGECNASTNPGK